MLWFDFILASVVTISQWTVLIIIRVIKFQELKSKVAVNTHISNFDDSANVVVEDVPIGDQEYVDDDDDNDTIEEEPGISSGGEDLFSESNEETETDDELIESSICS